MVRGVPALRKVVCWVMVVLCPLSLAAADQGSAMLHSEGGVWVNGSEVTGSIAVFSGDLIETKPGFAANLDAEGSSVLIQPESIVKFQGMLVSLEHGSVAVGTSTKMAVQVKCIKVEPVSSERTQYEVADLSGTVQIAARKNDVSISQSGGAGKTASESGAAQSEIVHEGEQATRDEAKVCGTAPQPENPGNALNSKWLKIGAGVAGGGLLLCLLLCKGASPISPSAP